MTAIEHDWFPRPLPEGTELGERSWLYSAFAFHHCHGTVHIGPDSGVYEGTQFELGPDGVLTIGRFCTIVRATIRSNGLVAVGDHTLIAHEVVIADTSFAMPPGGATESAQPGIRIGSGAWIGARAVILGGTRIGDEVIVGAGAVVSGVVPDGATVTGNPARAVVR